jgi:hypothetical protein
VFCACADAAKPRANSAADASIETRIVVVIQYPPVDWLFRDKLSRLML